MCSGAEGDAATNADHCFARQHGNCQGARTGEHGGKAQASGAEGIEKPSLNIGAGPSDAGTSTADQAVTRPWQLTLFGDRDK